KGLCYLPGVFSGLLCLIQLLADLLPVAFYHVDNYLLPEFDQEKGQYGKVYKGEPYVPSTHTQSPSFLQKIFPIMGISPALSGRVCPPGRRPAAGAAPPEPRLLPCAVPPPPGQPAAFF